MGLKHAPGPKWAELLALGSMAVRPEHEPEVAELSAEDVGRWDAEARELDCDRHEISESSHSKYSIKLIATGRVCS
jgi:hypothetical protein